MRTRHALIISALLIGCAFQMGCCMCANPFDHYYPAYGGITPRADMTGGRVGSAFRDAAAVAQADGDVYYGSGDTYALPEYDALDQPVR